MASTRNHQCMIVDGRCLIQGHSGTLERWTLSVRIANPIAFVYTAAIVAVTVALAIIVLAR